MATICKNHQSQMKFSDSELTTKPDALSTAKQLAWVSGFSHDLGKFVGFFQQKLDSNKPVADPVRHEWLSLQILYGLRQGLTWKQAWAQSIPSIDDCALTRPLLTGRSAIDYLVATHHRLPTENNAGGCLNNNAYVRDDQATIRPVAKADAAILRDIQSLLNALDKRPNNADYWRAVATYSRVALIMADHSVSAQDVSDLPDQGENAKTHANTVRTANTQRQRNQSLDWHLRTVGETAARFTQQLWSMKLPGLSSETLSVIDTPTTNPRFVWQDKTAELLRQSKAQPTLVFNMAGTGSGKTRANVRALVALNRGERPCRIAVGLNLRTLTLQTRDAFKDELGMSSSELACIIGSKVALQLHDADVDDDENRIEEEFTVVATDANRGSLPEFMTPFIKRSVDLEALLTAPVAVCTTDYLVAAGEPDKQGHHAMAMVRLMHSDLILDEIDSYDPKALIAVLRIVIAAAMWGRHVIVSSATLSPVIASAVFDAYQCGHRMHSELTGKPDGWAYALVDNTVDPELACSTSAAEFSYRYKTRVKTLMQTLDQCHRPAELVRIPEATVERWETAVIDACTKMHGRHAINVNGIHVSVGLVRCANIKPAVALSRALSVSLPNARICCYHSQHLAIQRFHIEQHLDELLTRKESEECWIQRVAGLKEVIQAKAAGKTDLQLIVVATPVEEIGRDHDFDWAVIDPSSAQSIVQTAGRVNRHRLIKPEEPNVAILQYPYRHCVQSGVSSKKWPTFSRPGLETTDSPYPSHDLDTLLNWADIKQIDARIRFDDHPFAICDDESIAHSIKKPMKRILGLGNYAAAWMSKKTYKDWPLREADQQVVLQQDRDGVYYKLEYIGHKQFKPVEQTLGEDLISVTRTINDWLVLELDEQVDLSVSKGLTIEDGLAVSIPSYRNQLMHDLSFGFY